MPTYCITGANRGLGLEFVRQIAADSSNTILACTRSMSNDLTDLKKVASDKTHILECNTGDLSSIKSFAEQAGKTLSGGKIDVLINNAATNRSPEQTALSIDPADLKEEINVNVVGPAKTTEFLLGAGLLAPEARIVNMTSGLGSMSVSLGITPRKCATYSISKAAVNALTVQQSGELREDGKLGGKCIVICMDPGWVKTRMGGEGAVLEPEESIGKSTLRASEGGGYGWSVA